MASVPPPVQPSQPFNAPASGAAVASANRTALLGFILAFLPLVSLAGLVLSIIALVKRTTRKGLAIAGIIISLTFPTTALLVSILLPSLGRARDLARHTVSQSNLMAIAKSAVIYQSEYDDAFPPDLQTLMKGGLLKPKHLQCPGHETGSESDYFYFPPAGSPRRVAPNTLLACELAEFSKGRRAYATVEGSVRSVSEDEFQELLRKPENAAFAAAYRAAGGKQAQ